MAKFAYQGTAVDGRVARGVERFPTRQDAELALYRRELRSVTIKEKKGLLQLEIAPPRVKREEVMHLSRQLAAFIRAGLPILEAVHTLSEEAANSSVKRMLAVSPLGDTAANSFTWRRAG